MNTVMIKENLMLKVQQSLFIIGGIFSVIFYFATFLFVVCSISTLTSVREEPLISSSTRNNIDTENSNDDNGQEIETDEKIPLLLVQRNSSKTSSARNRKELSTTNIYRSDLNNKEGFFEIDPGTGTHIRFDDMGSTDENNISRTLERSYQLAAATSANIDSSTAGPVPTQAFEDELKLTAKIVKLGIRIFLIVKFVSRVFLCVNKV